MSFRGTITHVLLVWLTQVLVAPALHAQPNTASAVHLPLDNEAALLLRELEDAVEQDDARVATALAARAFAAADALTPIADGGFVSAHLRAADLLARLSGPARTLYQQMQDGRVSRQFEDAASRGDVAQLLDLFERHTPSRHWAEIGRELGALLIDRGAWAPALRVAERVLATRPTAPWPHEAQRVVALAKLGLREAAQAGLTGLDDAPDAARREAYAALATWLQTSEQPPAPMALLLRPASRWRSFWSASDNAPALDVAQLSIELRRPPLLRPLLAGERVIVRRPGSLQVFDASSLSMLWRVQSPTQFEHDDDRGSAFDRFIMNDLFTPQQQVGATFPSRALSDAFAQALAHAALADEQQVYTVEPLATAEAAATPRPRWMGRGGSFLRLTPNLLTARRLADGETVWTLGDAPESDPLHFPVAPTTLDADRLLAAFVRNEELWLAVLRASDGTVLEERVVQSQPMELPAAGGRVQLAANGNEVFVATGNGVVAALELRGDDERRPQLRWRWAHAYERDERYGPRPMWRRGDPPLPRIDPILITPKLLIAAPTDSNFILAFDRYHGQPQWRLERRVAPMVIGATSHALIVAGGRVASHDLRDPNQTTWRSAPLDVCARGTVHGDRVYVPTLDGVVVLATESGRIIGDQWTAERDMAFGPAGNVVAAPARLFTAQVGMIEKLVDPSMTPAADDRFVLAKLEAMQGRLSDGYQRLAAADDLSSAELELKLECLGGLAADAPTADDRIDLLDTALQEATTDSTPQIRAWLLDTRLAAGRAAAALEGSLELFGDESGESVRVGWTGERRMQPSYFAAATLRELLAAASAAERSEWSQRVMEAALTPTQQLLAASLPLSPEVYEQLEHALVDAAPALPPEIVARFLSPRPDAADADALRGLTEAWAALVSAGDVGRALPTGEVWRTLVEDADAASAVRRLGERIAAAESVLTRHARDRLTPAMRPTWVREQHALVWPDGADSLAQTITAIDRTRGRLVQLSLDTGDRRSWVDPPRAASRTADSEAVSDLLAAALAGEDAAPIAVAADAQAIQHDGRRLIQSSWGLAAVGAGPVLWGGDIWWRSASDPSSSDDFPSRASADRERVYLLRDGSRIKSSLWIDGSLAWERVFHGRRFERVERVADAVLLTDDLQRGVVLDARTGVLRGSLPTPMGASAATAAAHGVIVSLGARGAVGIDPNSATERWVRPGLIGSRMTIVEGRPWVVIRLSTGGYRVLDALTGSDVLAERLQPLDGVITAAAAADERLYLAADDPAPRNGGVTLLAIDTASQAPIWAQQYPGVLPIDLTQLAGDPRYIPVLRWESYRGWSDSVRSPRRPARRGPDASDAALQLIDKQSGVPILLDIDAPSARRDLPLNAQLKPQSLREAAFVRVCGGRVLVQAGGSIGVYRGEDLVK